MIVAASLAQWRAWTGLPFDTDGPVADGLPCQAGQGGAGGDPARQRATSERLIGTYRQVLERLDSGSETSAAGVEAVARAMEAVTSYADNAGQAGLPVGVERRTGLGVTSVDAVRDDDRRWPRRDLWRESLTSRSL